jgi:hypothetical protein
LIVKHKTWFFVPNMYIHTNIHTHQSALGPRGGLWPVLWVIHKEGLFPSSGDINRLMMMIHTYIPLILYPRRRTAAILDISLRRSRFTKINWLWIILQTWQVVSPSPIAESDVNAINPLVAFYDIHGRKREVVFFYFVSDTTRDYQQQKKMTEKLLSRIKCYTFYTMNTMKHMGYKYC